MFNIQFQYRPPVFHRGAQAPLLRPSDQEPARQRRRRRLLGLDGLRAAAVGGAAQGRPLRGHAAARRRARQARQPAPAAAKDRQGENNGVAAGDTLCIPPIIFHTMRHDHD